ncbi:MULTISPECIES: GvpL/GvpF family gas vesicle protein [Streptomyces]|uniref:GvpL/GvpF family gas vesicle protein n=1 Tax=Streptomyces TaxID=1883 RepID=UPI001D14972B|nr:MULTISPECIES: GvpL/GvpF family gas vesicle protein [Streptomyces]MCC3654943.1 GvpL/GvpF family gas vesicle protein [Streptomyces sp. S07_1.15]WSQ70724.1 GvpL/GvpF family gas vesicle protein [Streptomyces xinghaiensis]
MSTYVYGIMDGDRPDLPESLAGVGDPPHPVRVLRAGGLAAVVSDCPEQLRPKRRDLLAHQHVLAEAGADGAVLPLRFGSLSADDDAVLAVLTEHAGHYRAQLAELDGRVEYNVKAVHREEDVLRLVVSEDPEIRALTEANRASGGGSHEDRLRLGELVAGAVRAREVQDGKAVEAALASAAEQQSPGPESSGWLVNLSFLMQRDEAAAFMESVEDVRRNHPHLDIQVTGPLPPYSFVRAVPAHA